MKLVAVSQRVDWYADRNEVRDALDQRIITFLLLAGFMPIPVPNQLCYDHFGDRKDSSALGDWIKVLKPLAVVLSGGNDIGQSIARDLTEAFLLDYAHLNQLPLLGICRGMQMMANWAGTGLQPVHGHIGRRHRIVGKIKGEVNSFHGYSLVACPADFDVLAHTEDGDIEAIRHKLLPWEGWMWHPEREESFSSSDVKRIQALFG